MYCSHPVPQHDRNDRPPARHPRGRGLSLTRSAEMFRGTTSSPHQVRRQGQQARIVAPAADQN
eukprot:6365511-Prymnesium_polylepis.1